MDTSLDFSMERKEVIKTKLVMPYLVIAVQQARPIGLSGVLIK